MKRFHLAILVVCLLCLVLAACDRGTSSSPTAASTGPQQIHITISEFYIHSPVTTFTTGTPYLFIVTNVGVRHHDFFIMHPMQTMTMTMAPVYSYALTNIYNIAPNQTNTLPVTVHHTAPPSMLEFSCHYAGHYEAGMHQAIVVNAAPGASVRPYSHDAIPSFPHSQADTSPIVSFDVNYVNGSQHFFTPTQVTIKKGQSITLSNLVDQDLTFISTPDAGLGNVAIMKNR